MPKLYSDTTPEAEAILIQLLREMLPWLKLEMVGCLNATARSLALSGLKRLSDWNVFLGFYQSAAL